MPVLLTCDSLEKSFGSPEPSSPVSRSVFMMKTVMGIIGPNGAGKSTFLQILGGLMSPDKGIVSTRKGVRLAMVVQDPVFERDLSERRR